MCYILKAEFLYVLLSGGEKTTKTQNVGDYFYNKWV